MSDHYIFPNALMKRKSINFIPKTPRSETILSLVNNTDDPKNPIESRASESEDNKRRKMAEECCHSTNPSSSISTIPVVSNLTDSSVPVSEDNGLKDNEDSKFGEGNHFLFSSIEGCELITPYLSSKENEAKCRKKLKSKNEDKNDEIEILFSALDPIELENDHDSDDEVRGVKSYQ